MSLANALRRAVTATATAADESEQRAELANPFLGLGEMAPSPGRREARVLRFGDLQFDLGGVSAHDT